MIAVSVLMLVLAAIFFPIAIVAGVFSGLWERGRVDRFQRDLERARDEATVHHDPMIDYTWRENPQWFKDKYGW